EQKRRFEERLADPNKMWKATPGDFEERKYWDDYIDAFEDALSKCSTEVAPWHIIPADRKWFRNLAVSQIIVESLKGLNLKYPKLDFDQTKLVIKGRFMPLSRRQALGAIAAPLLAKDEPRPNFLFILIDDLRYDAQGCTGHPFVKTPNIDRIAREGVTFTNAFVTTPLCSPSRASYLTGRYV